MHLTRKITELANGRSVEKSLLCSVTKTTKVVTSALGRKKEKKEIF